MLVSVGSEHGTRWCGSRGQALPRVAV